MEKGDKSSSPNRPRGPWPQVPVMDDKTYTSWPMPDIPSPDQWNVFDYTYPGDHQLAEEMSHLFLQPRPVRRDCDGEVLEEPVPSRPEHWNSETGTSCREWFHQTRPPWMRNYRHRRERISTDDVGFPRTSDDDMDEFRRVSREEPYSPDPVESSSNHEVLGASSLYHTSTTSSLVDVISLTSEGFGAGRSDGRIEGTFAAAIDAGFHKGISRKKQETPTRKTANSFSETRKRPSASGQSSCHNTGGSCTSATANVVQRNTSFRGGAATGRPSGGNGGKAPSGRQRFCVFCKNNREDECFWRTHYLKDEEGKVTCPILYNYTCPICSATKEEAHTVKYCPRNPKGNNPTFSICGRTMQAARKVPDLTHGKVSLLAPRLESRSQDNPEPSSRTSQLPKRHSGK